MTISLQQLSPELQAMVKNLRPLTGAEIQAELNKPTSLIKTFVLSMIALEILKELIRNENQNMLELNRREIFALAKAYTKTRHHPEHQMQDEPIRKILRPVAETVDDVLKNLFDALQLKVALDAAYKVAVHAFITGQQTKLAPVFKLHFNTKHHQQAEAIFMNKLIQWHIEPPVTPEALAARRDALRFRAELVELYRHAFTAYTLADLQVKAGVIVDTIHSDMLGINDIQADYLARIQPINKVINQCNRALTGLNVNIEAMAATNNLATIAATPRLVYMQGVRGKSKEEEEQENMTKHTPLSPFKTKLTPYK